MELKKLILITIFVITASSTVAASYSLTVTTENSEGELVTADEICVNSNCVEREFSHTFSVPENQDATITIEDSEYDNIDRSEYVFADMEKTYTLQQTERDVDQNVDLTIEAVNSEDEYVTADEICVDNSCVEREFSHTFEVENKQDVSISIEDSEYDNIQRSLYVSGDTTKAYELTRTDTRGSLEVHVEDNDGINGKDMEDARVKLSDGVNRGPKYTNSNGDIDFGNLPSNTDIDVEVKCYGETENRNNVEIDAGEQKSIEINFDEYFDSSVCGEDTDKDPEARFDIDDDTPRVEQWVNFDASDSEGNIENYHWEFGDGDTYTDDEPKISHRYNNEGDFEVELTVEEYDGDEDTKTKTVDVKDRKNTNPYVNLRHPDDHQKISLPYSLRWDVSDPNNDDVESTVYIARDKYDESDLDDEYIIREDVGGSESFRLYRSDLENREYMWGVKVTDEHGNSAWSNVRSFEVISETERSGKANLNVFVDDEDGDPIRDAKVVVDNGNWFWQNTDSDGEVSFEVQSGNPEITVSKKGYETRNRHISISAGENRDISFTLEERSRNDRDEKARLDVHVEDDGYDELEDAKVTVENGDREVRYTDWDGDVGFYLDSDDYDIEVECNGENEYRDLYLSEGEREDIDIRFDEDFDSDTCGEEDDDTEIPDDREDRDDTEDDEEGLTIKDVSYPNSVCRGGSFSVDMRIQNRGGFHELVTITGSGLGSINTGQSFALDIAETKSATIKFTNVEGSGTEEFDIRATNHVSDETTENIDIRDCGAQLPDTDSGDYHFDSEESATRVTAEVSPKKTTVGNTVKVKGYVDGVRGRSQVTIRANDERKTTVSTQPDGYYVAYIRLDQVGENIIKISSGQAETQSVVEAIPTSTLTGVSAPEKVFEGERYEICTNVDSQIEPKVFLLRDGKIIDSTLADGRVCFDRTASKIGEHEFKIKALTYGKESSSRTATTKVLEVDSEVTNFPDKVATTESEEGMVKVELYNTHNELRRYNIKLNGIESTWLSQSEEEVILDKGEKETVYFYLTPEEEGSFEPKVEVVSKGSIIYSKDINVYAGGTKTPKKTSFFDRLSQMLSL